MTDDSPNSQGFPTPNILAIGLSETSILYHTACTYITTGKVTLEQRCTYMVNYIVLLLLANACMYLQCLHNYVIITIVASNNKKLYLVILVSYAYTSNTISTDFP